MLKYVKGEENGIKKYRFEYMNELFFKENDEISFVFGPVLKIKSKEKIKKYSDLYPKEVKENPIDISRTGPFSFTNQNIETRDFYFVDAEGTLTSYFKGKKFGPAITYEKTLVRLLDEQFNPWFDAYQGSYHPKINRDAVEKIGHQDARIVNEKYYVNDKAYGQGLDYKEASKKHYFDDKQQFIQIVWNENEKIEYWYFDGELQSFGRLIYKDGTFKYLKVKSKGNYEVIGKDQVKVESDVYNGIIYNGEFKTYTKEYFLKDNPDIIFIIREYKRDNEVHFIDYVVNNTKENKEYIYRSFQKYSDEFFNMKYTYMLFKNEKNIKEFRYYGNNEGEYNNWEKNERIWIGTPEYDGAIYDYEVKLANYYLGLNRRKNGWDYRKNYLGNTMYRRLSRVINHRKNGFIETMFPDGEVWKCRHDSDNKKDGKEIKLLTNNAVYERFWENGKLISDDWEFVEYIEKLDELEEFYGDNK